MTIGPLVEMCNFKSNMHDSAGDGILELELGELRGPLASYSASSASVCSYAHAQ